jgi:GAF domain-containing protein
MIGERLARLAAATDSVIALLRGGQQMEQVARAVLEQLANAVRCEWGAYWTLDPASRRLQSVASWSALGPAAERFEQDARVRTLASSQGSAGQVWRSRRPIWTTHLSSEMGWPRYLGAAEVGLQGGVWFAVKTDTAIYGVVELLARALPYKSTETLAVVERTGFRIGYVLEDLRREPSRLH